MFHETITPSYLNEYGNVFKNDYQTPESINSVFNNLTRKYDEPSIVELDTDLFVRDSNNDSVQITGEKSINSNLFKLPSYVNEKRIGLSDLDILESGMRFVDLYDLNKQDFKSKVLPLLIIFICLKSKHFMGGSSISYQNGMFSVSFSSALPFSKYEILKMLNNNIKFAFFEAIHLINLKEISMSSVNVIHADATDGLWHSYMIFLDEDAHKTCLSLTRFWLSYCGELTRKEIEECTKHKYSERSINDALHKLIENGEVEVIGSPNSPGVKYKYILKEVRYI